jgi:hypothetical protein
VLIAYSPRCQVDMFCIVVFAKYNKPDAAELIA